MMAERDGCTEEDIRSFDALPYKNKVCFVSRPMPEIKSAYYIPGTERNENDEHGIESLTNYIGRFTGKRLIDGFDYVGFLNDMIE